MYNITEEYSTLFNAISDAINQLFDLETRLTLVQLSVEEHYISANN